MAKRDEPRDQNVDQPDYLKELREEALSLFGPNDEYLAVAGANGIVVLKAEDIGRGKQASRPIAVVKPKTAVTHVVASGTRNSMEIIAADAEGRLWAYDFRHKGKRRAYRAVARTPAVKLLADGVEGRIHRLLGTRRTIVIQTEGSRPDAYHLYALERRSLRLRTLGELSLDRRLELLHPRMDKLLVGFEQGELRLIEPGQILSGANNVHALDIPRVTAATMLTGRYLLVAQKGGQLSKVDIAAASAQFATNPRKALARTCKLLCELLRRCGCVVPPEPGRPGGGRPGGGRDEPPCDERHEAKLQWTVDRLAVLARHVVAFSAGNRRMAVLDHQLNLKFERFIGHQGAYVAVGAARTQNLALYDRRHRRLEAWSLADYVGTLPGLRPELGPVIVNKPPSTVTYYGQRHHRGAPNPDMKVCVFTVVEPGQAFTDPNQNVLMAQMEARVLDIVNDYYDENSFGDLDVQFSVFGYDFGGTRTPLVLPRAIAAYFYDNFTPGGVQAVMPADGADPAVLDGTESLVLRTHPRVGTSKDYPIPFAALWVSQTHNGYPVVVDFDGSETLQLTVETQVGDSHVLDLAFGALSLTHNQGDDEAAFLNALATHFTSAIRAAEAALPDSPVTIQDVNFRRIRLDSDPTRFGQLQGQFKVEAAAPADFVQKGTIEVTLAPSPLPAALQASGFSTGGRRFGTLTSSLVTRSFLESCLSAAQADAGEGPGLNDPHFETSVTAAEDAAALELTVLIRLTNSKGGAGANIEVLSHSGHDASGWSAATPLPGSESNVNNQNTLRDAVHLADDVFTAALDHIRSQGPWNADNARALFEEFDCMLIGFVGEPTAGIPVADRWGASDPVDFGRLRMFKRTYFAKDLNNPNPADPPVTMGANHIIGQPFKGAGAGILAHELGHVLGLPDLYSASGFRDDVLYIDSWAMMGGSNSTFNHFCGWSKWVVGWVTENSDEDLNRVVDVPLPAAASTETTEAWLVPLEHWDSSIKSDVRGLVGGTLPIAQLMKIHLGSDAGVVNFLELRAPGVSYSQSLPPSPAVIATNVLHPDEDRRWAVNGLYRRSVHRLNQGNELMVAGDQWDFASGQEFPLKGCKVEVVDVQSIRAGNIPVFRMRVEREQAEFIDLHFQDHAPSWRSPDIWIDWPGDNPDPNVPRVYPIGTPTDQGETVRFPASGTERHFLVARVHNAGNVRAEQVKVRWFICDPPGVGDSGRWVERDTKTLPQVEAGVAEISPFDWLVDSATNEHQCLRAEIIDWTIPAEVDPATGDTVHLASDDVKLQNNSAQQNVFDFEALSGSPYAPIEFQMLVHNDNMETEVASLVPDRLPWGTTLDVSPAELHIDPGTSRIFHCKLTLDDTIIKVGCDNDRGFLLTAWRLAQDADERWGSCFYFIRPRYKTGVSLERGYWSGARIGLFGRWQLLTSGTVDLSSHPPLHIRIRLTVHKAAGDDVVWRAVPVDSAGNFVLDIQGSLAEGEGHAITAQAWFDRTELLGSSVSRALPIKRNVIN